MCYIDGQQNKYSVLNECNRMLKYNIEFLPTDPEAEVRFPALSDFLRSSASGTGSTQPREYNRGVLDRKSSGSGLESREYGLGIRHADHVAPSIRKSWH
jgi:hypothetical protein